MFPQKRNENDLSVSVSAEIRSVRRPECPDTKSGVSGLSGCPNGCSEYPDIYLESSDCRSDVRTAVRSIMAYTRSLQVLFCQRLRLAKQDAETCSYTAHKHSSNYNQR